MKEKLINPKIPLKEIHEILSIELAEFKYIVIAIDKEDWYYDKKKVYDDKTEMHVNMASNFSREDAINTLEDILKSLKTNQAYESSMTSKEAFKRNANNQ